MSASTLSEEITDAAKNIEESDEASSSTDSVDDKIKKSKTFEWFYERKFDKYFEFVKAKSEKTVSVRCLLCPPQKTLTVTTNSAYNLSIHIKSIHKSEIKEFTNRTQKRKRIEVQSDDGPQSKQRQSKLDYFSQGGFVSQVQLDRLVFNHIIDKVLPFSTVESESFNAMVLTGKPNKLNVIHRNMLGDMLLREHRILNDGQIQTYASIQYFCLTADLWSSRRRAFLGVTIHWICPESYSRKKNSLACRRITGVHSSEVLARNIHEIIQFFKIPIRKILKIITDGGTNFKKAMKDHQIENDEATDDDESEEDDLANLLHEGNNDEILLPPHDRCASHSLCLILTSDIKLKKTKKKKNGPQKRKELTATEKEFNDFREHVLDPVLTKCQNLFNKQSNSPKASDLIHSYLHRYLITPSPTRWNSLFDSVVLLSTLLDEKPKEMECVTTGLGLENFNSTDSEVLKEYIEITRNVADALDVLQGELYMYQGVYSPTIHKMKQKINDLPDLQFCEPLKQRILNSIEKRFPNYMRDDCLKAMLLHPLFKSYPMLSSSLKSRLTSELAVELQEVMDKSPSNILTKEKDRADIQHLKTFQRLFDYSENTGFSGSNSSSICKAEVLLHNYLSDDSSEISSLKNYPEIGRLFIKYNTVICSSAACERLFSLAKFVLTAKRCQLTNESFEAQLILKSNLFPSKNQKK